VGRALGVVGRRDIDSMNRCDALIDFLELNKCAQCTLQAVGLDGLGKLRSWVDALPAGSPLRAELQGLDLVLPGEGRTLGSALSDVAPGNDEANAFDTGDGDDALDGGAGDDLRNRSKGRRIHWVRAVTRRSTSRWVGVHRKPRPHSIEPGLCGFRTSISRAAVNLLAPK
jgi:hypothetical protein